MQCTLFIDYWVQQLTTYVILMSIVKCICMYSNSALFVLVPLHSFLVFQRVFAILVLLWPQDFYNHWSILDALFTDLTCLAMCSWQHINIAAYWYHGECLLLCFFCSICWHVKLLKHVKFSVNVLVLVNEFVSCFISVMKIFMSLLFLF